MEQEKRRVMAPPQIAALRRGVQEKIHVPVVHVRAPCSTSKYSKYRISFRFVFRII